MADVAGQPPATGAHILELLTDPNIAGKRIPIAGSQTIYDTDSPAQNLYYLESGQVRIHQVGSEHERLSDILGPGAWFGMAAIAGNPTYGSRAQAVGPSIVWAIDRERLLDRLTAHPQATRHLLSQLARRLKAAQAAAAGLVFEDCNMRLVRTLLEFSNTAAAVHSDQGVVLRITHQELADAVGAARETISLALTQLRRQNLLRTGRNRLTFNPQVLARFSELRNSQVHSQVHEGRQDAGTRGRGEEKSAV